MHIYFQRFNADLIDLHEMPSLPRVGDAIKFPINEDGASTILTVLVRQRTFWHDGTEWVCTLS